MDKWRKGDDFLNKSGGAMFARNEPAPTPTPAPWYGPVNFASHNSPQLAAVLGQMDQRPLALGATNLPGLFGGGSVAPQPDVYRPPFNWTLAMMNQGWLSGPIERHPSAFLPGFYGSTAMDESGWIPGGMPGGDIKKYIPAPSGD